MTVFHKMRSVYFIVHSKNKEILSIIITQSNINDLDHAVSIMLYVRSITYMQNIDMCWATLGKEISLQLLKTTAVTFC